jgi:hypothetical protein
MMIKELDHLSVVVDDLAAAVIFSAALAMIEGEMPLARHFILQRFAERAAVGSSVVVGSYPDLP